MTRQSKLDHILDWQQSKPTKNSDWAEDVKKETLHIRTKKELNDIKSSLVVKFPKVQDDLDKFNNWPDAIKYELNQQFSDPDFDLEGKTVQQWIDGEFAEQHTMYKWKVAKLEQSIDRLNKELYLRVKGIVSIR